MSNNTGTNKPFQRKGPPTESDRAWSSAKYPGKWDSSKKYPAGKPFVQKSGSMIKELRKQEGGYSGELDYASDKPKKVAREKRGPVRRDKKYMKKRDQGY
tara:strand:+ start:375 stop:674 length:300 start_codon:yes stop_codon:yes gene_type:complete